MEAIKNQYSSGEPDYNSNIKIADGIFWVGLKDEKFGLQCNSYLITDGDEAVLIDGGSRNDFSTVVLKIMRAGVNPAKIIRLIYQHYDPDLCGNLPHMEVLIKNDDLKVLSHYENNVFIDYYSMNIEKQCIEEQNFNFTFSSGRRLEFIHTPYAHALGSFVTYDTMTKTLFSSDIFGSYDATWELFTRINERCSYCTPGMICPITGKACQVFGITEYHKRIMSSAKALSFALRQIESLDAAIIAPQHGSILNTPVSQKIAFDRLKSIQNIGIDHYLCEVRL